jgi:predicted nuclease with TOPRIM domain
MHVWTLALVGLLTLASCGKDDSAAQASEQNTTSSEDSFLNILKGASKEVGAELQKLVDGLNTRIEDKESELHKLKEQLKTATGEVKAGIQKQVTAVADELRQLKQQLSEALADKDASK